MSGRGVRNGNYERGRFEALAALLRPQDTFWDVGAHYGYASLIASGILDDPASLVSIEPSAASRWYLRRHLAWNRVVGSHVVRCAVAERDREDSFGGTGGSVSFHLGHRGERVAVRSLDSLLGDGLPVPTFLKVDVEGAEALVLEGGPTLLAGRATAPTVFMSVHTPALLETCLALLKTFDYTVYGSTAISNFVAGRASWTGDPDVLCLPARSAIDPSSLHHIPWFAGGAEL